jgi:hypothetical protein
MCYCPLGSFNNLFANEEKRVVPRLTKYFLGGILYEGKLSISLLALSLIGGPRFRRGSLFQRHRGLNRQYLYRGTRGPEHRWARTRRCVNSNVKQDEAG